MRGLQSCLPWMRRSCAGSIPSAAAALTTMRHKLFTNHAKGRNRHYYTRHLSTMNADIVEPASLFSVRVNTCSQLYMDMYESRVNVRKPLTGVDFDVVYADTMPSAPSSVPIVLALHGVAGSHCNFYPLLPYLASGSNPPMRIIMPNFPGYGYTAMDESRAFEHSDEERAHLILDFLKELNIPRVHVLVAHSAGVYTALALYEMTKICQSFLFVNPGGLRPVKMMTPVVLYRMLLWVINLPILRHLVNVIKYHVFKDLELFKALPNEGLEAVGRTMLYIDYAMVKRVYVELALKHHPLVLAASRNDSIVGTYLNEELMKFLDLDESSLLHYDANGTRQMKTSKVSDATFPKGLLFDKTTHFLLKAYPEILAKEIVNLLTHVESLPTIMRTKVSNIPRRSPAVPKL